MKNSEMIIDKTAQAKQPSPDPTLVERQRRRIHRIKARLDDAQIIEYVRVYCLVVAKAKDDNPKEVVWKCATFQHSRESFQEEECAGQVIGAFIRDARNIVSDNTRVPRLWPVAANVHNLPGRDALTGSKIELPGADEVGSAASLGKLDSLHKILQSAKLGLLPEGDTSVADLKKKLCSEEEDAVPALEERLQGTKKAKKGPAKK